MRKLKRILVLSFFWGIAFSYGQPRDSLRVLFIGNSYTFNNDLPQLFVDLSKSAGRLVAADANAPGGYTLELHTTDATTLEKLSRRKWDFVVLQEQSQVPTIDYYPQNEMYPAARFLDSLITRNGAKTVLFMTWGRKYGGKQCIKSYCSPVFRDFFHMQDSLKSAYMRLANEISARLAPVGMAWKLAVALNPSAGLWAEDYSHPSLHGSYLAACVFYATLFSSSPVGLSFTAGLSHSDASFYQDVAYRTVKVYSDYPISLRLYQNYPNPFNSSTTITFSIPQTGFVILRVYDLLGKEIRTLLNEQKTPGTYDFNFQGGNLSSGVYFYRVQLGGVSETKKFLLIK